MIVFVAAMIGLAWWKAKPPSPPVFAPSTEAGEVLLNSARKEFTAASSERQLLAIRKWKLGELALNTTFSLERRQQVGVVLEALFDAAYARLAVPQDVELSSITLNEGTGGTLNYPFQEVLYAIQNTGKLPVAGVFATITTFASVKNLDGKDAVLKRLENVALYETAAESEDLQPGATFKPEKGHGQWIADGAGEARAARCEIKITRVIH
jgi:hypothetical protein